MLSIERDKRKRLPHRSGCDKRIEDVEPVRFCVRFEKLVSSRSDAVAERDDRIHRQETIDSCKFPFVSGADNEFHRGDLRDRPRLWESVYVFDCRCVAARDVNQDVAIDQEWHTIRGAAPESAVELAAKPVDVFDTVGHVLAVLPHAGEERIRN
jgi:hypothetical protein